MKKLFLCLLPVFVLLISCEPESKIQNSFSSETDTLLIHTTKIKGTGVFQPGTLPLRARDTSEYYIVEIILPTGIDSIRRLEYSVDFVRNYYFAYKGGQENLRKYIEEDVEHNYIDTSLCLPESESLYNIIEGYLDGNKIFIVDENNNKDLTDDSIRRIEDIETDNPDDFVEFRYNVYDGKEFVSERSWLGFRYQDNLIWWGKKEHTIAEFTIDEKSYKIAIGRPHAFDFVYDFESTAPYLLAFVPLNDNEVEYEESEYLQLGQYMILDSQYYCLQNLSRDGKELTLVKEDDFQNQTGIQVGLKAPEFNCITIDGDSVHSIDLKDKGIIIVNMCGCGGDYESVKAYDDILSEFGKEYHVLGVDSQFFDYTEGVLIDSGDLYNEEFYKNYRQMYCSRKTYVIDKDFRIASIFNSIEWQAFLEKSN